VAVIEVDARFAANEGWEQATERLLVLGAINGALQARHSLRGSRDAIVLHESLEHLLASLPEAGKVASAHRAEVCVVMSW